MATSARLSGSARTVALILAVLGYRRRLRRRDRWSRPQLLAHQLRALARLRAYAYDQSPFYQDFHAALTDAPLSDLPVLTKQQLMDNFDRLVTQPSVRLAAVEQYLTHLSGNELFRNRYYVSATAGTTGQRGIFLWDFPEWVQVVSSYNRPVPPGEYGAKVLVTVLFSRTLPLIRYEMSDSLQLADAGHDCPCGRPYALISGVQGREQEALSFATGDGQTRTVQPVVFHHVMDAVTAAGWQIRQHADRMEVLVAQPRNLNADGLAAGIRSALTAQRIRPPSIAVREVAAIPRTALGKAPLIIKG